MLKKNWREKMDKRNNNTVDMKVTKADNKVQFYVEELQPISNGIRLWKIAKVFYSMEKATRYIRGVRSTQCS